MNGKIEEKKQESRTQIALKRAAANIAGLFDDKRRAGGSYETEEARTIGFDLLRAYAYEKAERVAESVLELVREAHGGPDDPSIPESIEIFLQEETDSALIYTADQWAVAVGLDSPEFDDAEETGEGLEPGDLTGIIGRYAYHGLLNAARWQLEVLREGGQ